MNLSIYSTAVGLLPTTTDFLDEILRHATFQYSVHNAASLERTLCKNLDQGYIKINGPVKGKFLLGSRAQGSILTRGRKFLHIFAARSASSAPSVSSSSQIHLIRVIVITRPLHQCHRHHKYTSLEPSSLRHLFISDTLSQASSYNIMVN